MIKNYSEIVTVSPDLDAVVIHHDLNTMNIITATIWNLYNDGRQCQLIAGVTVTSQNSVKINFPPPGFSPRYRVELTADVKEG